MNPILINYYLYNHNLEKAYTLKLKCIQMELRNIKEFKARTES